MTNFRDKLKAFAGLVQAQRLESLNKQYPNPCQANIDQCKTSVMPGTKYARVDVGTSGAFMVDTDGNIFGIKGYGVIHRGHCYGTLDTVSDYWWGEYHPVKIQR